MENTKATLAIATLDGRSRRLVKMFGEIGARAVGFDSPDQLDAVCDAAAVLLPIPLSRDGIRLAAGSGSSEIMLTELMLRLSPDALVIGGMIPADFAEAVRGSGGEIFDLNSDEDFLQSNAYATAEGAICEAARELTICIKDADCAIVGYGRIARHLHRLLSAFGVARVTVYARRAEARWDAVSAGAEVGGIDGEVCPIGRHDLLFNTVPERVIGDRALARLGRGATVVELASAPGGFDRENAEEYGLRAIALPSLPARYAPESAAEYLFASAVRAMRGHGINI